MILSNMKSIAVVTAGMVSVAAGLGWSFNAVHAADAANNNNNNNKTFMIGTVGPSTQPIWDFGYADKITDADWANIQQATTRLTAAIPTVASGGNVPAEQTRAKSPVWQDWTKQMSDAVQEAKAAADKKDQMALQTSGDKLLDICAGCHTAFDPTPSKY
jgi:cytochrome c556